MRVLMVYWRNRTPVCWHCGSFDVWHHRAINKIHTCLGQGSYPPFTWPTLNHFRNWFQTVLMLAHSHGHWALWSITSRRSCLWSKMAATTELVIMFICFAMMWRRWPIRTCASRRRRRMVLLRRQLQAFNDCERATCIKIVSAIVANRIIGSMLQRRSLWIRNWSQAFTDITASWDDLEWKINFWVNYLCTSLGANLLHSTVVCVPISVEKRIAIALWRLGTNVEYRTISHLFGVGILTACIIVREVCKSIVHVLSQKYIKIPTGPQAMDVVRGFEERWHFP